MSESKTRGAVLHSSEPQKCGTCNVVHATRRPKKVAGSQNIAQACTNVTQGGRGGGRRVMAERCAGVSKRPFNCDNSALVYFLKNRHMCTSRLGFHLKVLVYEICDILFTNNANENATTTWPTKTRPHNILCIYKHSRKK